MPFVSLFLHFSHRSILLLHEQAWPCSSSSLDMLGSTNAADEYFGIGCWSDSVRVVYKLYDLRSGWRSRIEYDSYWSIKGRCCCQRYLGYHWSFWVAQQTRNCRWNQISTRLAFALWQYLFPGFTPVSYFFIDSILMFSKRPLTHYFVAYWSEEIVGFCSPCTTLRGRQSGETELISSGPMVRSVQEIV